MKKETVGIKYIKNKLLEMEIVAPRLPHHEEAHWQAPFLTQRNPCVYNYE